MPVFDSVAVMVSVVMGCQIPPGIPADPGFSDYGVFGDQLIDLGGFDGAPGGGMGLSGMGRRRGGRRGGAFDRIGSHADFIRGLTRCQSFCPLLQIPYECQYTPVRQRYPGRYCQECPIDICQTDSTRWPVRRRSWRRRIRDYLCRRLGICGVYGRGRQWGRTGFGRWRGRCRGGRCGSGFGQQFGSGACPGGRCLDAGFGGGPGCVGPDCGGGLGGGPGCMGPGCGGRLGRRFGGGGRGLGGGPGCSGPECGGRFGGGCVGPNCGIGGGPGCLGPECGGGCVGPNCGIGGGPGCVGPGCGGGSGRGYRRRGGRGCSGGIC